MPNLLSIVHQYFLLFIFYTFLSCFYSLFMIVFRFTTCGIGGGAGIYARRGHHHLDFHNQTTARLYHRHTNICLDKPSHLLTILGLLIEAILFGMFTACMMFDQASVVNSKMTHIDRLKGSNIGGSLAGIIEVFGVGSRGVDYTRFRPDWLSPFARVCFPSSLRDEVMGFCRPCASATQEMVDMAKASVQRTSNPPTPHGAVSMSEIV